MKMKDCHRVMLMPMAVLLFACWCGCEHKKDKGDDNTAVSQSISVPFSFPAPVFTQTRENIEGVDNLDTSPQKPLFVPKGTTNVALGKEVTSSDSAPILGELDMITDGDKEANDYSMVELGPLLQHITIDLGQRHTLYAIVIWHYHKVPRVFYDVVVQVSDDPDFIDGVVTLFNNDTDGTAGLGIGSDHNYIDTYKGKWIDAKGVEGRYVRCYSRGSNSSDLNQYIEVEVYGKPITE